MVHSKGFIQRLLPCTVFIALVIGLFSTGAWAQGAAGRVRGTTADASGGIVPGAEVALVNTETNLRRTATTDATGTYVLSNIPPGAYQIEVTLTGFQTTKQSFVLALGEDLTLNITLKVGSVTESVEVTAEALAVQTRNAEVSGSVSTQQVRELPLAQRDFRDLTSLLPGVAPMPASNTQAGGSASTRKLRISVAGGRVSATSYYFDGIYMNQRDGMAPEGISGSLIGIDAIREFRVLTNSYSARFGRGGSGVIDVVSRGGTNQFHGTVFEYVRNSMFDARNFFSTVAQVPVKPPLRRNQFGFTFGGPIRKDSTFFFVNWEAVRERNAARPITTRVPDVNARNGLIPVGGVLTAVPNLIGSAVAHAILDLYPLPNGTNFGDGTANSTASVSSQTRDDVVNVRIDQKLSTNHTLFGRYTFNDGSRLEPTGIPVFTQLPVQRSQWITLQEDGTISPRLVNSARIGFTRLVASTIGGGTQPDPIIIMPQRYNAPVITISPLTQFNPPGVTPRLPTTNNSYQVSDDLMFNSGRHSIEFGARAERYQTISGFQFSKDGLSSASSGTWTFDSLALFYANNARLLRDTVGVKGNGRKIEQTYYGAYVQWEYQMRSNLSLSTGLRFEYSTPPDRTPDPYKMINLSSDSGTTMVKDLFKTYPVLAPRLGLAWQPFGNGTFVVRAGAGMFYDQFGQGFYNLAMGNYPYTFSTSIGSGSGVPAPFPNPYISGTFPGPDSGSTFTLKDVYDVPTIIQYNLSVTKVFPKQIELSAAYVGNQSSHLSTGQNWNPPGNWICSTAQPCPAGAAYNGRRFFDVTKPKWNPNFAADIVTRADDGKAYYHSMQLSATQRFGAGSAWQAAYTFSKCIDNGSAENTGDFGGLSDQYVLDIFDMANNRGPCSQDVHHRLVTNVSYRAPYKGHGFVGILLRDWTTTGVFQMQSGSPFTPKLTIPRSASWLGASNSRMERPDIKPGRDAGNIILGGPDKYYDPSAFTLEPAGFYGNSSRNMLTGPGLINLDLSLARTIPLHGEGVNLQVRAESFNFLNHPNFGVPNWQIFTNTSGTANPASGQITDTSTAGRQMQFSLKLSF